MNHKTAVITGAGSGVGAAVALTLGREGWRVALVGRRAEPLERVAAEIPGALVCVCDVREEAKVRAMGEKVLAEFGSVAVLVNAAGTNVPRRSLEELLLTDYHATDRDEPARRVLLRAGIPAARCGGAGRGRS